MARVRAQRAGRWSMHLHFEPSRVREAPLIEAYEAVLPIPRRRPVPASGQRCREQQPLDAAGRRG
jgi:hypothetical protein